MQFTQNLNEKSSWQNFSQKISPKKLCERGGIDFGKIFPIVEEIEKNILEKGDVYISELTEKFDGVKLENFLVPKSDFDEAEITVSEGFKKAIDQAYNNIFSFHSRQKRQNLEPQETSKGVFCWQEFRAIEKVGLYIPGGSAPLFSTVLMLAIPAIIAGCAEKIICTPPQKNGKISPEILYTAKKCGIEKIFMVGGAQAIFAMAYGTDQIPKVDKIFGPGNSFVTAAKMKISSHTAIDMPAGPSEVLVMADENANAVFCAADLLSQAEHGADSQSVLVCLSEKKAEEILEETKNQLEKLPRKEIAQKALENSFCVVCENLEEMIEFSNLYAPEHLILQLENWESITQKIQHAGSVFCGKFSCESAGDYASGTNHTLPTSAFARNYSGVCLESFGKWVTFQHLTQEGLEHLGDTIELMAEKEGLWAHGNAVKVRRKMKN